MGRKRTLYPLRKFKQITMISSGARTSCKKHLHEKADKLDSHLIRQPTCQVGKCRTGLCRKDVAQDISTSSKGFRLPGIGDSQRQGYLRPRQQCFPSTSCILKRSMSMATRKTQSIVPGRKTLLELFASGYPRASYLVRALTHSEAVGKEQGGQRLV